MSSSILQSVPDFTERYPLRKYLGTSQEAPLVAPELLQTILRKMFRLRALEESFAILGEERPSSLRSTKGLEATLTASVMALDDEDWLAPGRGEAIVSILRGMSESTVWKHVLGHEGDPTQGHALPGLLADREHKLLPAPASEGAHLAQAAGIGWAMRLRKSTEAVLVLFGQDAAGDFDFHNGLNFSEVFSAPVVFLCHRVLGQDAPDSAATIAQKAIGYGMTAERVDGGDALAVYSATREAIDRARAGKGPTLLEMVIDPAEDGLEKLTKYLSDKELWSAEKTELLQLSLSQQMASAKTEAEAAKPLSKESLLDGVFIAPDHRYQEQKEELSNSPQ